MVSFGHSTTSVLMLANSGGTLTNITAICAEINSSFDPIFPDITHLSDQGVARADGIDDFSMDISGKLPTTGTEATLLRSAYKNARAFELYPHGTASGNWLVHGTVFGGPLKLKSPNKEMTDYAMSFVEKSKCTLTTVT